MPTTRPTPDRGNFAELRLDRHRRVATPSTETTLLVESMTCASCVARVEKALLKVPGVSGATVNLAAEKASIQTLSTVPIAALKAAIEKAGYAAKELQDVRSKSAPRVPTWWPVAVAGALTLPLVMPMLLQLFGIDWMLDGWLQLALATPVQFASVNTTSRLGLPRASGDGPICRPARAC